MTGRSIVTETLLRVYRWLGNLWEKYSKLETDFGTQNVQILYDLISGFNEGI